MQIDPEHEGPYPLLPIPSSACTLDFHDTTHIAQWFSTDLALTHNVIIRALNSIWLHAPLVLLEDENTFAGYGLALVSMIRWHHDAQEKFVFPRLQLRVDMRSNVVQHLAFEAPVRDFEAYLDNVHDKVESFDSDRVLELRRAFGGRLVQHLHDEINTVSPENLASFNHHELTEIARALEEHKTGFRDSTTLFPFIVTGHNREHAPNWPTVPVSLKWFANHVGLHLHRHYWKFSPYTITGEFQTYPPHDHHEFNA